MTDLKIDEKALMGIFESGDLVNWQMTRDYFDRLELRHKWAKRGRQYEVKPIHVFTAKKIGA